MCVCALLFRRCARSEAGCRRIAGAATRPALCLVGRPGDGVSESLENRRFPGGYDEMTEGCAALGGLRLRACTPWTPGGDTAGACGQGVHKDVDKSVDSVDSFFRAFGVCDSVLSVATCGSWGVRYFRYTIRPQPEPLQTRGSRGLSTGLSTIVHFDGGKLGIVIKTHRCKL